MVSVQEVSETLKSALIPGGKPEPAPSNVGSIIFDWVVAYAFIEPLVIMLLSAIGNQRAHANSPLLIVTDLVYSTIAFIKTMFIYRHVLKKPNYFPEKDDTKGLVNFILVFVTIRLVLDIAWSFFTKNIRSVAHDHVPILNIFSRYQSYKTPYMKLIDLSYEAVWVTATWWMHWHLREIDDFALLFAGLFFILLLGFTSE